MTEPQRPNAVRNRGAQKVIVDMKEIRRLLNRSKVEELRKLCFRWGVHLPDDATKPVAVKTLLEGKLQSGMTHKQYAETDITQCIAQPSSKLWNTCKLCFANEGAVAPTVKPSDLEQALNKELNMYYKQYTAVRNVGGVTWARIGIEEERYTTKVQMQTIFLVHHSRSHFVFLSQAKKGQLPYLLAAMQNAFKCREVNDLNLAGKDLASLAKMCLETQGRFSSASLTHAAGGVPNPLLPTAQRSSKRKPKPKSAAERMCWDEDAPAKKKRRVALTEVFGVDELPPALQCVEFKVKGGYKGTRELAGPFHMHVRFEGPNVVAGFRELLEYGMAELPYPVGHPWTHCHGPTAMDPTAMDPLL